MALEIRLVTGEEEKAQLYRFRYSVYVNEVQFTQHADHERGWLKDEYDDIAYSLAIFDDDRILGSLRLIYLKDVADPSALINKFEMEQAVEHIGLDSICTTSRFMVDRSLRNGKVVFKLIRAAYSHALENGARLNFGDCSPHMIPFYEHMGYRRYTSGFNDSHFGYKIPILMLLRDLAFMGDVRSILLRLAKDCSDDEEARRWFEQTYPGFVETKSALFLDDGAFLALLSERLAQNPTHYLSLLRGLDEHEANAFLAEATLFPTNPNDLIIRKGDTDSSVYLLLKGLAHVKTELDDQIPLASLGAGDTFGEIGFLTTSNRSAFVIAQTACEVMVLTGAFLTRFLKQQPLIAAKVLFNLATELAARLVITSAAVPKN